MKRIIAIISLGIFCACAGALAQDVFPAKQVRFVVPFSVGGASDVMARLAGSRLAEPWGHPPLIDNRTGADGRLAVEYTAKSPPDGYTLLVVEPAFVIAPSLFTKLPFDTARDFTSVTMMGKAPLVFVVHPSFPAKSTKEFIAIAKARPGDLNFATQGNGSAGHLTGELLKSMAGINFVNVHYRGAAPALIDLLTGQSSFAFVSVASSISYIQSNRLRALGVSGPRRFFALPDVPTMDEGGVKGFETLQWWGVVAPAATPKAVIARLNADLVKAMGNAELRQRAEAVGVEVATCTPETVGAWLTSETAKWGKVARVSGAKVE